MFFCHRATRMCQAPAQRHSAAWRCGTFSHGCISGPSLRGPSNINSSSSGRAGFPAATCVCLTTFFQFQKLGCPLLVSTVTASTQCTDIRAGRTPTHIKINPLATKKSLKVFFPPSPVKVLHSALQACLSSVKFRILVGEHFSILGGRAALSHGSWVKERTDLFYRYRHLPFARSS